MKKSHILILVLFITNAAFAQTDWERWGEHKISYTISPSIENMHTEKTSNDFAAISQKLYKNLFSNYDGDNCAFYPSCSAFFVKAVHKTNFINGALLFVDRFTRDLNFAKALNNYPIYKDGHFYDPLTKYIK